MNIALQTPQCIRRHDQALGGWVSDAFSKAKSVVSDASKSAVNVVTRPTMLVLGKDPVYSSSDFDTKVFQKVDTVQKVTTAAGAAVAAGRLGVSAIPGKQEQVVVDQVLPGEDLKASGVQTPGQIALMIGGTVALLTLVYFATDN